MASIDEMNFVTAFYAPGVVGGNAEDNLPVNYPEIQELLGGLHIATNAAGTLLDPTPLVVKATTATPGAGFISLSDGNTFRLGTAADILTRLVICYKAVSGVNDKKLITAIFVPGAVAVDVAQDLPTYYPEIDYVIGGVHMEVTTDDVVRVELAGAVPTGTLGSGYVSKSVGNAIIMGDQCTTSTLVVLTYRAV